MPAVERERAHELGVWQAHTQADELVFCTALGTLLYPHNVHHQSWRRVKAKAALPAWAHPHTLRHTAAAVMLAAGVPLPEVTSVLGHASPAITAAIYAHVVRDVRRDATARLAAFYAGQSDQTAPPHGADHPRPAGRAAQAGEPR